VSVNSLQYPNTPTPPCVNQSHVNAKKSFVSQSAPMGQLVRTLNLGFQKRGRYLNREKAAYWDGRNETGERVASGVYFYVLKAGNFAATRKMVILK